MGLGRAELTSRGLQYSAKGARIHEYVKIPNMLKIYSRQSPELKSNAAFNYKVASLIFKSKKFLRFIVPKRGLRVIRGLRLILRPLRRNPHFYRLRL